MKGQTTIISIIVTIVMLVLYGAFLPTINTFITATLPNADPATSTLLQLTPAIILILIIAGVFTFGRNDL